jgi:glutamate racemase
MEVIQDTVSTRIELIDSALWTAIEAQNILEALDARIDGDAGGLDQSCFYVTDMTPNFERNAERFLGNPIKNVVKIPLEQITTYSQ